MKKQQEDLVPVGYRVPKSVLAWLTEKAAREDRSKNWVVNRVLQKAMQAESQGAHQ